MITKDFRVFTEGNRRYLIHGPLTNGQTVSWPDAMEEWTEKLISKAMTELESLRPELYARFKLAKLNSTQLRKAYVTKITGQPYCEVSAAAQTALTLYGGIEGNPGRFGEHQTAIPHIEGGFVQWYEYRGSSQGMAPGYYATICQIVLPSDWQGTNVEAQNWIDFVDSTIQGIITRLKAEDDQRKEYNDTSTVKSYYVGYSLV